MRARQLARVSVGVWAVTLWNAVLGLITTPYLIHHLGAAQYGIFALVAIISTYLSNLEIGFGQATLRFVARARAAGDTEDEEHVLRTSMAVFVVAGATATTLALLGSSYVAAHFVHGEINEQSALDAIRLGAVILLASLLANFAAASLQAVNRFGVVITARLVIGTLISVGSVTAVAAGGGLTGVMVVLLALNTALAVGLFISLGGSTSSSLAPRIHRPTFVTMAKFGVSILIAGLAFQALLQGPPTILAGYSTTDQVAAYAVPSTIMLQIVSLMAAASFAFAPFASAQSVSADRTRLSEIFRANVRVTVLLAAPISAYLALLGSDLLAAWIGGSFAVDAAGPLRWLSIAALMLAISAPPSDVLRGLGRPGHVAIFTIITAALTVGGSFALVQTRGATGVAAAVAGGLVVGATVLLFVVAEQQLAIPPRSLMRAIIGPLGAACGAALLFALGAELTSGFVGAVATGFIGTAVYAGVVAKWVLDGPERAVLAAMRPRLRHAAGDTV